MNEEIETNSIITYENTTSTTYDVACNINTMVGVLTFVVIIIFMYKFLKNSFTAVRK